MNDDEHMKITLRELMKPELAGWTARVEALEREKEARGEFVEAMDRSWLPDLEKRLGIEPDRYIADHLISHANVMTALMLHRRISNLEKR